MNSFMDYYVPNQIEDTSKISMKPNEFTDYKEKTSCQRFGSYL
jgi:hypothetical protein